MALFNPVDSTHRRYHALTGQWVLVYPHRAKRPWQGAQDFPSPHPLPNISLCAGRGSA